MENAVNPSIQGQRQVDLRVPDQPGLHRELQTSQGYFVRPCHQNQKQITHNKNNRKINNK